MALFGDPLTLLSLHANIYPPKAQTEIKEGSGSPSASNFLEREKALLGDDANQFATVEDADFDDDNDLLGGGLDTSAGAGAGIQTDAAFESQFPDLSAGNEVRINNKHLQAVDTARIHGLWVLTGVSLL